ncbi:MAG: lipoprotein-releasing ABC transporter permease subunit [Pseudomonadales bacterium]|jgi:lipoprotein-releasing system permease protein|tara:strand:- start:9899 stop:11122 length:1224 start_codon:yes stop_codon:yes gene_type:complete
MNVPLFIGLRFSTAHKGSSFLSFITRVSMIGLMLGVMSLIVVVSVMNGFDSQLKYRILGAIPHVIVSGDTNDTRQDKSNGAIQPEQLTAIGDGARSSAFLGRKGIVIKGRDNRIIAVHGILPEQEKYASVIPENMKLGHVDLLKAGSNNIVLGQGMASQLAVWPGDKMTLIIPTATASGQLISPKLATVVLVGTFELQSELDYSLALMHLQDLKNIVKTEHHDTRLTLNNIFNVSSYQTALAPLDVVDWTQEYGDFFETVKMEKIMMFMLLTLIVMIAAFNTVSGLSMMVKDKKGEIAVLRTMGLSRGQVMQIFIVQGSVIGVSGTLLGMLLGIPLAYHVTEVVGFVEDLMGGRMLAGTYFDRVPTDVRFLDTLVIVLVSFLISILATLYPAYRATKLEPAEVLRSE